MRTAKWLASSVMLFLFLRALIVVQGRPHNSDENDGDDDHRLLSRTKRFSMNEYLMLALSVFNVFVFLYNNIETFFPAAVKTQTQLSVNNNNLNNVATAAPQLFPPFVITSTEPAPGILPRKDDFYDEEILNFEREQMINQIAEMLIR